MLPVVELKEGIFNGPQIREMFKDEDFVKSMNDTEKAAQLSFKHVATKFLGNNKDKNYRSIVENMVKNFKNLGCLMNFKLHFLKRVIQCLNIKYSTMNCSHTAK